MILYKYIDLASAKKILTGGRIGFSLCRYFNDPFDKPVATPEITSNPVSETFAGLHAWAKSNIWESNTGILSLTRTATNALMWAHYADGHSGTVLEIDIVKAGFTDVKKNMIPAQYGSVIYSRNRQIGPYSSTFGVGVSVGETHHFVLEHYEKWQRLFLTKPLDWAYEEEVRVAKCLQGLDSQGVSSNESGNVEVISVKERPLHCFAFPIDAILRVVIGARANEAEAEALENEFPTISVRKATLDAAQYEVKCAP